MIVISACSAIMLAPFRFREPQARAWFVGRRGGAKTVRFWRLGIMRMYHQRFARSMASASFRTLRASLPKRDGRQANVCCVWHYICLRILSLLKTLCASAHAEFVQRSDAGREWSWWVYGSESGESESRDRIFGHANRIAALSVECACMVVRKP